MEGNYLQLMEVVEKVQQVCYNEGVDSVLCYLKIQSNKGGVVTIEDKTGKYD